MGQFADALVQVIVQFLRLLIVCSSDYYIGVEHIQEIQEGLRKTEVNRQVMSRPLPVNSFSVIDRIKLCGSIQAKCISDCHFETENNIGKELY